MKDQISSDPAKPNIVIVISVLNEEGTIMNLWEQLQFAIQGFERYSFEFIFVNDGSTDKSESIIKSLVESNTNVVYLGFSRNYGHEAAMLAGIDHTNADAVICMDADLQHPPDLIPKIISEYEKGFDIIRMIRENREDGGLYKKVTSAVFYSLLNKISPIKFEKNASDFFLISKKICNILKGNFRERTRFIRGILQFIGFKQTTLSFNSPSRNSGKTKYSFYKLLVLSFDAIVSFSKLPLHLGLIIGILFALFSFGVGIYSLIMKLTGETPAGYTTLVVLISMGFAIQFFLIGIIGVYIGYNFNESKQRPIYIIEEILKSENMKY
ncbi:MAG: glycosyltransferase [Bacteroidota bacterium]